ncbi:MAG: dUTP diphosphatase [Nanoarchaeota archaeon]
MKLQIEKIRDVNIPKYAHEGDAGLDLYSAEEKVLKPGEKDVIKTGVKVAIPSGYVGLIWDRSGLAVKNGLHCLAGVIDSGYRGEIGVAIINLSKENFNVEKNMRIAQMLIQPVFRMDTEVVDSLDETTRNEGGFGSTGLN